MGNYWLVYACHDEPSDIYLSLLVGVVPADQLEKQASRTVMLPFGEDEIALAHVHTFDHEPSRAEMDELAPPGHRSTDG